MQRKRLTICRQTDRWTSSIRSFNFVNQYALLWTPNAYRDILMRIFTPSLFFQCVFTNFQCVITLLRTLSVALLRSYTLCCNVINEIFKSLQEDTYRFWGTKVKVTLTYSATLCCNVITQTALGLHIPYFIHRWKEDTYMYRFWGQKSRSYWHVQSILSCNTIA